MMLAPTPRQVPIGQDISDIGSKRVYKPVRMRLNDNKEEETKREKKMWSGNLDDAGSKGQEERP